MLKALGFGAVLQILCMIIAITTGNIDQAGNYAEYLAFGLLTLAGLMVLSPVAFLLSSFHLRNQKAPFHVLINSHTKVIFHVEGCGLI
ncbi:hypothetical protein [Brevibacillus brevis]|uniref:hypothetical protein n=1 Tax=Brevibacillus brevis TaxID=1393 RepID=UPI000D10F41C|nr:hypothetical protein [Brevibacillus brevis]PSJ69659.1 hypothetical protein C7J99_09630 [Brevibacillus brevis]RED23192.1 hypothetical protein DES34_115166 [Brevibacillus brevis]GEC89546.1 hypothetical protein BBR01nite_18770 [Brevibacillus brevis]VEF87574.1 Uncharacterised protein [Brevibacillus brevis]